MEHLLFFSAVKVKLLQIAAILYLAPKSQIHEFSLSQDFNMHDFSINHSKALQDKLINYTAIIDSGQD